MLKVWVKEEVDPSKVMKASKIPSTASVWDQNTRLAREIVAGTPEKKLFHSIRAMSLKILRDAVEVSWSESKKGALNY